jgi:hypothetical protein
MEEKKFAVPLAGRDESITTPLPSPIRFIERIPDN